MERRSQRVERISRFRAHLKQNDKVISDVQLRRRFQRNKLEPDESSTNGSADPETDQQNQDKRSHSEPRDRNDFDPHVANGRNIVVDARIAAKESVTVAKEISAE